MKVLLVAYEFPPSPSPQSLRWKYFVRELARLGMEVHVLCPDARTGQAAATVPEGVAIHRTYPGLITGTVDWIANWHRRRHANVVAAPGGAASMPGLQAPPTLNWKGRLLERMQAMAGRFYFPDSRGEWRWFASRTLRRVLEELDPDVVISSHEPATSIEVGLLAKRAGFPWVVDLGDPVLSFYTPARWRRRSLALEHMVCKEADHVFVTTERARLVLAERHAADPARISVLTQGFDAEDSEELPSDLEIGWADDRLELLYTGSFYHFRHPRALVDAVESMDDVRLTIASSRVPEWLSEASARSPEKIRLLGFLRHSDVVRLQKQAQVLVNLANDDAMHVPGKLYEYVGAGRPILHVGNGQGDAGEDLVRRCGGVVCGNEASKIIDALNLLHHRCLHGDMVESVAPDQASEYSWQSLGAELARRLEMVAR